MKTRLDFVTNSSSSSFVCDKCDECFQVYDGDDDTEECENEHGLCNDCGSHYAQKEFVLEKMRAAILNPKSSSHDTKTLEELFFKLTLEDGSNEYENHEFHETIQKTLGLEPWQRLYDFTCPLCSMENISYYQAAKYQAAKSGRSLNEIYEEIRTEFKHLNAFEKWIQTSHKKEAK